MKKSARAKVAGALVLVVFCLASSKACARPPRAREFCGVLECIDQQNEALTIRPAKGGKPLEVIWKKDTQLIHNWKFDSAASLKDGGKVCLYYRSPIFGRPFATRVVWGSTRQ